MHCLLSPHLGAAPVKRRQAGRLFSSGEEEIQRELWLSGVRTYRALEAIWPNSVTAATLLCDMCLVRAIGKKKLTV